MSGASAGTGPTPPPDTSRRRVALALASAWPVSMLAAIVPAAASRMRGAARLDVRGHGARGDGVADDTAAFQRAVDALPEAGGTVQVPAGTYVIDPRRSVRLRDRMHLALAPDATLRAMPTAAERSYVLLVSDVEDVEVSGGRIVGDRDSHLGTGGEWGHGIAVRGGRRVSLRDVQVSRCWGDGVSVAGERPGPRGWTSIPSEDVLLTGLVCTGNRRQGLTIGHARDVVVRDCEFSETAGTRPECGIDIEPDAPGDAVRIHIEGCRMRGNQGSGLQIFEHTRDVTVRGCTIDGNAGYGILAVASAGGVIAGNTILRNGYEAIALRRGTAAYSLDGNTVRGNRMRRPASRKR